MSFDRQFAFHHPQHQGGVSVCFLFEIRCLFKYNGGIAVTVGKGLLHLPNREVGVKSLAAKQRAFIKLLKESFDLGII